MIRWTRPALADLHGIRTYIAVDSPTAARQVAAAIRASTRRLSQFPLSAPYYAQFDARKLSVVGYRYIVFYRVVGSDVRILRVRHSSEDWLPR